MLYAALFSLVTSALVTAFVAQISLQSDHRLNDEHFAALGDKDYSEWSLDMVPNPNATDHLVFDTVYSLLQWWPNSRMTNGHAIVPGIIPKGTRLYHAAGQNAVPPGPEWVALDPEHSHWHCADYPECWHLTLATTRPLRIVYFDGGSAIKYALGTLDTQDLIIWGESRPENTNDELRRLNDLCKWVKQFGMDGIVRLGMNFEVMLCDFTSGVSIISFENITYAPGHTRKSTLELLVACSWHNYFPGETRIQLDLARLVSFYDTRLVPSLVAVRAGQGRWDHRAQKISTEDLSALKSRLETALARPSGPSSGIDWKTLLQVIVDRFAARLELTRHLLNSAMMTTNLDEMLDLANKTQAQLRTMLTPYLFSSVVPVSLAEGEALTLNWTAPVYEQCATTHTRFMAPELDSMTESEKLLLQAVRGTSREICRAVTKMWARGVQAGIDSSLNTNKAHVSADMTPVWSSWAEDLNRLMGWLDWSLWVKCDPVCGPEEICFFHNPPYDILAMPDSDAGTTTRESLRGETWSTAEPGPNEWTPRCVSRVDLREPRRNKEL